MAAHRHGRAHHLLPRQHTPRLLEEPDTIDSPIETVISVVFVSMAKTFSGDAVWVTQEPSFAVGAPVAATTSVDDDDDATSTAKATSAKSSAVKASSTKDSVATTSDAATSRKSSASTMATAVSSSAAASSSAASSPSSVVAAAVGSASVTAASASASATSAAESGMSAGAKAGLAFGILLAVAALLGAVLFVYRRKKQQAEDQNRDDEKTAMQNMPPAPAVVEPAPSIRTQRTMSTAPRLSLRPVTQFSATFEQRKSSGNLLGMAAAGAGAGAVQRAPSPETPSSPWERFGASNAEKSAAPAQNPFQDPSSPTNPQNPFGNSAAIDSSPQTAHAATNSNVSNDFANPGAAITSAEATPIVMSAVPMAMSTAPIARQEVVAPPQAINADSVPPSPAWTEDIPASPGPAPSGPLPIAGGAGPGPGPNNVHRIQMDFKPSMQDELELRAGQLVRMLHEYDDGWALCVRMDRSQQGVAPRTCLSKHPVKPRAGPPRQGPAGPPGPRGRGPPGQPPMTPGGGPRPLTPNGGRNSPHPPVLSPARGRMSPSPRAMSPGPRNGPPPQGRPRAASNVSYRGPRSMSPGPYGGGPQNLPSPKLPRPRSNSASSVMARRASPPGPSPMNPNAHLARPTSPPTGMPARKPVPGLAL